MRLESILLLLLFLCAASVTKISAQSVTIAKDFSLGSPFREPDGRSDMVMLNGTDFVTLAKVKGSQKGKSDFTMQRYDAALNALWQTPLAAEDFEDYKDVYYNGKDVVLLSVIHQEDQKKTKLEAYGFDPADGKKIWAKELESFDVGEWQSHPHKGRVKESFIDLVCEHTDQDFVTPFEYKHNISFSPDQEKFVSYVYNYGEPNLTATVSVYDKECNLLKRGKISVDGDYTNYGFHLNNAGMIFILNANNLGKVNLIKYDMDTKDFDLLELPSSNFMKDDFHVRFVTDEIVLVGNTEVKNEKIFGVMYSRFDFGKKQVEFSVFHEFDQEFRSKMQSARKNDKQLRGEEDWMDYDLTHFIVNEVEEVIFILEKRVLHADGYPHVGRGTFDKSHKVEFTGHVQAETILMFAFQNNRELKWKNFILKNQVYPANDGLNTISLVLDDRDLSHLRLTYATSENLDASLRNLNLVLVDKQTGVLSNKPLPNENKLTYVKDYTLFTADNGLVIVGKKGLLGKSSMIMKYKL